MSLYSLALGFSFKSMLSMIKILVMFVLLHALQTVGHESQCLISKTDLYFCLEPKYCFEKLISKERFSGKKPSAINLNFYLH